MFLFPADDSLMTVKHGCCTQRRANTAEPQIKSDGSREPDKDQRCVSVIRLQSGALPGKPKILLCPQTTFTVDQPTFDLILRFPRCFSALESVFLLSLCGGL